MKLTLYWLLALTVANISLSYRLPNETHPEHYAINIDRINQDFFTGQVIIDIAVTNSTKMIILNSLNSTISNITIENTCTHKTEKLKHEYDLEREFLILKRKNGKRFSASSKWKLNIYYLGAISPGLEGIFSFQYSSLEEGKNGSYFFQTFFENGNARRAFPCYDEPGKQANFTISISHNANQTAISNMPVNAALSSENKTVFLTTPRISINKVGFFVSDFDFAKGNTTDNILQRAYFSRGKEANVQSLLSYGEIIYKFMQEYTGVKDMLPKLDYVALPREYAKFTANWGLITYPETALNYKIDYNTMEDQIINLKNLGSLISQQWFGGYVSIQWWSDFWLRTGLADLFIYKALIELNILPQRGILDSINYEDYNKMLDDIVEFPFVPLAFYGQKPLEIRKLNYGFPYQRNTFFLLMWNNALTDDVFRKAIQYFLEQNQYSAVVGEQFFAAIQHAADELNYKLPAPIGQMMSTWIHQGSYPLLTITRNYQTGSFHVKQQPFHRNEICEGNTWYVPINYATATNHDFNDTAATHYLLNETEMEVNATIDKEDWLLVNKQSTGLYRVIYDEKNYQLLTKSLLTGKPFKIPVRDRAQLLRDTYHWWSANQLNKSILWNMLTYLSNEDQYLPWTEAIPILKEYYHYLSDNDDYIWFARELISPIFAKTGVNDSPGEGNYDKLFRAEILDIACLVGVEECLVQANNKLKAVLNGSVTIEPYLKDKIFCNGLRQPGDEEFQMLYKTLIQTKDRDEREQLVLYFTCSRNRNHIMKLISAPIDNTNQLQPSDRTMLLNNVCPSSRIAILACMDYISKNLKNSSKFFSTYAYDEISNNVFSEEVRQKFLNMSESAIKQKFLKPYLVKDLEEKIAHLSNIKEEEKYHKNILPWIKNYRASKQNLPIIAT